MSSAGNTRPVHPAQTVRVSAKRRLQFGNLYEQHLFFLRDVSQAKKAWLESEDDAFVDLRAGLDQLLSSSREMLGSEELERIYPRYGSWIQASQGDLSGQHEAEVFKDLLVELYPVLRGIKHLEGGFEVDQAADLVSEKWDDMRRKRGGWRG